MANLSWPDMAAASHFALAAAALRCAEEARTAGRFDDALRLYQSALDLDPCCAPALLAAGALLTLRGQYREGAALLRRCRLLTPHSWQVLDALGAALLGTGEAEAFSVLTQARTIAPRNIAVALRTAQAAVLSGNGKAELARLAAEKVRSPGDPLPPAMRGAILLGLSRAADAIPEFEVAAALCPESPLIASALAQALLKVNGGKHAVAALARALELAPNEPGLRSNYAVALTRQHRYRAACEAINQALVEQGESHRPLANLAGALSCLAEQEAALALAKRTASCWPESHVAARSHFTAAAYAATCSGRALTAIAIRAADAAPRSKIPAWRRPARCSHNPGRPLRVGLLSAGLRCHPVGWLTVAGFETLDPRDFQLVCLGMTSPEDTMQRRFRAIASWSEIEDVDDTAAVAVHARALDLDIAVELGGNGDRGFLGVCAGRVAPVQIKWVGTQSHTTGMNEIDWFVTDRWETPPGLANLYSERLLVMPDGYVCYTPPLHAPAVSPLPALSRGYVTFGCFNNLAKLTPPVIELWSDILRAMPSARLVLRTHSFTETETANDIRQRFAAQGIAPGRVDTHGPSQHRTLLAAYADVDIVLDPFPYSGGVTTCEALWMGVPVITMPGETFCSRHSTSHLCNAGLASWVAPDMASYRELAIARSRNLQTLSALRARLRGQVRASPLCDAPRFGRNLGAALKRAWECSGP